MTMPHVRLLDARRAEVDEQGLRDWARTVCAVSCAPHVTRSYRWPWAVVSWHDGPVGVDLERVEPVAAAFAESIVTPSERPQLDGLDDAEQRDAWTASLWSSKEALAKALGDAVLYDPRRLESPMRWSDQRSGPWRAARLNAPPGHAGWLCWSALPA